MINLLQWFDSYRLARRARVGYFCVWSGRLAASIESPHDSRRNCRAGTGDSGCLGFDRSCQAASCRIGALVWAAATVYVGTDAGSGGSAAGSHWSSKSSTRCSASARSGWPRCSRRLSPQSEEVTWLKSLKLLGDLLRLAVQIVVRIRARRLLIIGPKHLARFCVHQEDRPVRLASNGSCVDRWSSDFLVVLVGRMNLAPSSARTLRRAGRSCTTSAVLGSATTCITWSLGEPLGEVLIESASHGKDIDRAAGRHTARTPESREKPLPERISLQSQFIVCLPSFTAVIPVHNRADLLERLLDSVRAQTVPFDEIVVVDNASTDGAAELARARGCRVIDMGENAGFARAVNRGWRAAATRMGRDPEQRCRARQPLARALDRRRRAKQVSPPERSSTPPTARSSTAPTIWSAGRLAPGGRDMASRRAEMPRMVLPDRHRAGHRLPLPPRRSRSARRIRRTLRFLSRRRRSRAALSARGIYRASMSRTPSPSITAARPWAGGIRAWCD